MERVTGIPSTRRSTPRSGQASHPLPLHSKSTSWAQAHLLNLCGAGGWRLLQPGLPFRILYTFQLISLSLLYEKRLQDNVLLKYILWICKKCATTYKSLSIATIFLHEGRYAERNSQF